MLPVFNRPVLLDMLTYCRPAGSPTERAFITKYIATLPGAYLDSHDNWHVHVDDSPVLWSCHTDTVHAYGGRQTLHVDADTVGLSRRYRRRSHCLGADDTAGVFLMWSMVLAQVPGHYVFHYGEETGGIGSSALSYDWPAELSHIRFAIALDRRGTADIITHQGMRRTASDTFAESLAAQLNDTPGLVYAPCSHGIYTDTAEYAEFIPECTNLSVGYAGEHGTRERLDMRHLETLFTALCNVDHTTLVESRVPSPAVQWSTSQTWSYIDVVRCEYCTLAYFHDESDAADNETYCCEACETQHLTEKRWTNDNPFLSDEYRDVQLALRLGVH